MPIRVSGHAVGVGRALLGFLLVLWLGGELGVAAGTGLSPEQLIATFGATTSADAALYAINRSARADPAGVRKAALAHVRDVDAKTRYAALYALALTAEANQGADVLATFLASPVADERLLAAAALSGLRDKRGLPVLIDALSRDEPLTYRGPGERANDFAKSQLLWFTTQDFGLKAARTPEAIAATKVDWEQWWQRVGHSVHFDPGARRFVP